MMIRRAARPGLSLLEVLLAMAIFLIALVGIGQLMNFATDQALEIDHLNRANQLLQSTMNEVIAGWIPLTGSGKGTFAEEPNWSYVIDSQSEGTPGLNRVTVTVTLEDANGQPENSWTLSQFVLDPAVRGVLEPPPAAAETEAAPSSTTPMPSGGGP